MKRILVCGIGTDVGKTLVSAILVKALGAHYWKPVQAGGLDESDSHTVKRLVPETVCYPEAYRLRHPLSPHHAAALEKIELNPEAFRIPASSCPLVIEAAGGILVPFRSDQLLVNLYLQWDCDWIVVSRHYIGSINHTLLTLEALQRRKVRLLGIIFNGTEQLHTEQAIFACTGVPILSHLYPEAKWTPSLVQRYAHTWKL